MKSAHALVLAITALTLGSANAATKDEVIKQAVKKGATIVVCDNGWCKDWKTKQLLFEGQNGMYLMFPPGHEEEEQRTARQLAQAE